MRASLRALALASIFAVTALPTVAHADPLADAKKFFNTGAQFYDAGQFDAAIAAFEKAYELAPKSAILFSVAQAYRRSYAMSRDPKALSNAADRYRKYIEQVKTGGRVADATAALGDIEASMSAMPKVDPNAPPATPPAPMVAKTQFMITAEAEDATVQVDGGAAEKLPLLREVTKGTHVLRVSAPGYGEEQRNVDALEHAAIPVDFALREKPALLRIQTESGADIVLDGKLVGTTPLLAPIETTAGKHSISVIKNGRRIASRDLSFGRSESRTLQIDLATTTQRYVAYGLGVVGVGAIVTGAVYSSIAISNQHKASAIAAQQAAGSISHGQVGDYDDARSARNVAHTEAGIAYGVGALAILSGVLAYSFDRPSLEARGASSDDAPKKPAAPVEMKEIGFAPIWLPNGGGASLSGKF